MEYATSGTTPRDLVAYLSRDSKVPFEKWYRSLTREDRSSVDVRLRRIRDGNFGDSKPVGEGVSELRFKPGKGLRIYFGLEGQRLVILLAGGDKSTQDEDILRAKEYWRDCKERGNAAIRPL